MTYIVDLGRAITLSGSDYIALFSGIGTFLAAIATFLTVREVSKQRKTSYRPEIVVPRITFEGSADPRTGNKLPSVWNTIPQGGDGAILAKVPLINIGLGAAKNVSISWNFPVEETARVLAAMLNRINPDDMVTFRNGILSVKSASLGRFSTFWKNEQTARIDYVLPASTQSKPANVDIPHTYNWLVSSLILTAAQSKAVEFPRIAPLQISADYYDVADERRAAVYELELEVIAVLDGGATFHAYLEPKRQLLLEAQRQKTPD